MAYGVPQKFYHITSTIYLRITGDSMNKVKKVKIIQVVNHGEDYAAEYVTDGINKEAERE